MDNSASSWLECFEHAEITDVGLRRSNNQDSYSLKMASTVTEWRRRGCLFIVADGMGAHAAGELASKIATDTIPLTYFKLPDNSPLVALTKAIEDANAKIYARGSANPDFKGMGTTSSALLILPQGAVVGQVGDSRVYRLRGQTIQQLSFDHSLVWEMRAAGRLQDEQTPGYIPKNIITRSLGPTDSVKVDIEGPFPLADGDTFLLCSDGLSGQVEDEELGLIIGTLPPHEAVQALVDLANLRGGPDNITVIVVRVGDLRKLPSGGATPRIATGAGATKSTGQLILGIVPWVLLLVAGLLMLLGHALPALGFAVVSAVWLAIWGVLLLARGSGATWHVPGGRMGNGPHASADCRADAAFIDRLVRTLGELTEAARQHQWQVDWNQFNALVAQGEAAAGQGNYQAATAAYCRAISFVMRQGRNEGGQRDAG